MHHFSQKSVAITNVLVYTCLFFCIGTTQKSRRKKPNLTSFYIKLTYKTGSNKIIGNLKLIFGCTPFGENNWNQSLPITINKFPTPLTGILNNSSFANCSRFLKFEGCPLATAILRPFHGRSMGFRPGLIAGHFRILQHFVSDLFWVLCEVWFGSLSCWNTHDLWRRPSFLTRGPTLQAKIFW